MRGSWNELGAGQAVDQGGSLDSRETVGPRPTSGRRATWKRSSGPFQPGGRRKPRGARMCALPVGEGEDRLANSLGESLRSERAEPRTGAARDGVPGWFFR